MANQELETLTKKLVGRKWYHQRFDGAPLFLSLIAEAENKIEPRKPAGTESRWRIGFFADGKSDWYLDQEDIDRGAAIIQKLVEHSASVSSDLIAQWKADDDQFGHYFWAFNAEKLTELDDQTLLAEFQKFHNLAIARFTSSAIIDHFALGTDKIIADSVRQEAGPFQSEGNFSHIFSIGTAPVHQSFINEAEIALLQIAIEVQNGALIESQKISAALLEHQKKYFWTSNNYVRGELLPVEYFKKEVESWVGSGKNLQNEFKKIQQTPHKNKNAKVQLFSEHHFSDQLKRLLKISEDFTWWQDERKKATYLAAHIGTRLVEEMGQRKNVGSELLKYLLPSELIKWFKKQVPSQDEWSQRRKGCVVIWERETGQVFIGPTVEQIHTAMFGKEIQDEVQDIRGLVASTGRARGTVKLVMSAQEINKVQEGDIIVAVMTRPDYVPAMKRAGAIVTDEGGITSHAAIVSRELGIPCIIGTKIATKTFKDGDLVEVNANHNWVRRV